MRARAKLAGAGRVSQVEGISVAMATCDGARFIDAQLESIEAQIRAPDELVVCDDASTDDTVARVRRFEKTARFAVRIFENPERLGVTKNFERAVRECSGELIFLADQDDRWLVEKVASTLALFERDPQVTVAFSNATVVDADGTPLGYDLWSSLFFDRREQAAVQAGRAAEIFMRRVIAAGTTMAFRGRFKPLLLPFPDLYSAHDAWIAFMLASVGSCEILPQPLVEYHLHGGNQIGIERLSLRAQLEQARRQIAEQSFARSAEFFELARTRFAETDEPAWKPDAAVAELIDEKILHMRCRDEMSPRLLRRLPTILRETLRGHYWRFGYGAKSVAQDLFLR